MPPSNQPIPLGVTLASGRTHFRIWAPACQELTLELQRTHSRMDGNGQQSRLPRLGESSDIVVRSTTDNSWQQHSMQRTADGCFELELPQELAGATYRYVLAGGQRRPDPTSRFQPEGVHGPSQIVDACCYQWRDTHWQGVAKEQLAIYEIHLGTFTDQGTYQAASERLVELKELGITAVELMPLAESAGKWNWGYDGVLFFAPRHTYGTPDDFRHFVDSAHELGLAVILDVVFNHFGPEGNYFRDFGPYISDQHSTAWGDAPNFDSDDPATAHMVRSYFCSNVRYWIEEFHLDGLRVDAIHCMADDSPIHIVSELADEFAALQRGCSRPLHLIAESNVYDARMIQSREGGGHGYDAQWCDDFLHSVFAILRPGEQMSQRVYHGHDLECVLHRGYVFAGSLKMLRQRIELQQAPTRADLSSLVYSIQNHDFIGNHPRGQRLHLLTSDSSHRAAAALMLLYPAIPMLFMGEEFACPHPFYFFVDYSQEQMRQAVERGRRAEYPQHDWSGGASPTSPTAFLNSKIGPTEHGNRQTREWYRALFAVRKQWQQLGLLTAENLTSQFLIDQQTALLRYASGKEKRFAVVRLSNQVMQHESFVMQLDGQVDLSQCCHHNPTSGQLTIEPNAVAVGHGSVTLNPADVSTQ